MKIKFIFIALLMLGGLYAQQDAQFTQYMYNTINVNPAYAGSRNVMSTFVLHRSQWIGLEGAPTSYSAAIHTPIPNSNFGIGFDAVNDRIGISDENNIATDFSYSIKTNPIYTLAFGLKFTANFLSYNYNRLTLRDPKDYEIGQQNNNNRFSPNIGAGIFYYSDKNYLGLSVPQLLETRHYDDNIKSQTTERLHFYLMGGHVFEINDAVKFKPATLVKLVTGAPLQLDLSANFLFNEKLTLGVAYRLKVALSAMAGFKINDAWTIGYGYDFETTRLAHYNSGSHEIFLRYEFLKSYDKIISPRFF